MKDMTISMPLRKTSGEKVFRMTPAKRTVEVLNGVGKYTILGEKDKPLYTTEKMKDYTVDESGKKIRLLRCIMPYRIMPGM